MWSPERSCIGARSRPIVVVFSRCVLSFIVRMIFIAHRRRGIQQLVLFLRSCIGPFDRARRWISLFFQVRVLLCCPHDSYCTQASWNWTIGFFLRSCIGPFDRAWRWISLSLFFSSACHPLLSACLKFVFTVWAMLRFLFHFWTLGLSCFN